MTKQMLHIIYGNITKNMCICCAIYGSSYMKSHSGTNVPNNSRQLRKYIRGLTIKIIAISCFLPNPFTYEKKVKVLLYPMPHFFCFLEGSQTLTICFSGRSSMYVTLSVEHWWNDSGKRKLAYLEAKKKKNCPSATLSTTNLRWISLVLNPGLWGRGQQITAWAMAWFLLTPKVTEIIYKISVPTSNKTLCIHYKDHLLMLLWRNIIVYCYHHLKTTNTLCGTVLICSLHIKH